MATPASPDPSSRAPLDRLWAGWRTPYVEGTAAGPDPAPDCVFCGILASDESDEALHVVWRGTHAFAILNAYPYTNGHLMVMPYRHVGELEDLTPEEGADAWRGIVGAVQALKQAYRPDGINAGINLGRSAGAGVPGHFHVHALPRWNGDTNFMTTVAETRVLPESLDASAAKLRAAWQETT